MKTEAESWREERLRIERSQAARTLAERLACWFDRPSVDYQPTVIPEMYRWHDVGALIPVHEE